MKKRLVYANENKIMFYEKMREYINPDGFSLQYDTYEKRLVFRDKDGNTQGFTSFKFKNHCDDIKELMEKNLKMGDYPYKELTDPDISRIKNDIINSHQENLPIVNEYDSMEYEWRKTPCVNPSILDTPLFEFRYDPYGSGEYLLKKIVLEIILRHRYNPLDPKDPLFIPQMDQSYLLIGKERIGKSSVIKYLSGGRYKSLSNIFRIKNPLDQFAMLNKLQGLEIAEANVIGKEDDLLKDFLTTNMLDTRRLKTHDSMETPRTHVCVATSNNERCLTQGIGHSRFLPLVISNVHPRVGMNGVDLSRWLIANYDQIFAAGIRLLDKTKPKYLEDLYPLFKTSAIRSSQFVGSQLLRNNEEKLKELESLLEEGNFDKYEDVVFIDWVKNNLKIGDKVASELLKALSFKRVFVIDNNNKKVRVWATSDYAYPYTEC